MYWLGNPCSDELCGISNFIIPGEVLVISFCPKIIDAPRTRVGWWVIRLDRPCCTMPDSTVLVFEQLYETCSRKQILENKLAKTCGDILEYLTAHPNPLAPFHVHPAITGSPNNNMVLILSLRIWLKGLAYRIRRWRR